MNLDDDLYGYWPLYMADCKATGARASLRDFLIWYEEREFDVVAL